MTAAVVPLPLSLSHDISISDAPAEARKRRREILASQRGFAPATVTSEASAKKRKVLNSEIPSSETNISRSAKKPQMKYDPDVPMTKEEATAWRREQRRKRNRESAAASRQRQRDRIAELEVEVEEWKSKFEEVMAKISKLEELTESPQTVQSISSQTTDGMSFPGPVSVSPLSSPKVTPCTSTTASPVTSIDDTGKAMMAVDDANQVSEEEGEPQPTKMISRPAVKISGLVPLPLLPEGSLLSPDPCSSSEIKLEPIDSNLFPCPTLKDKDMTNLATEEENETEFGEFLLDAVDWL